MRNSFLKSSDTTAFLLDSQIPGGVRWTNGGYTFVAVLPRVGSSHVHAQAVATMNMAELLISLSSALDTMRLNAGGVLQVPLGDLWAFDGAGISKRFAIALTLSDKTPDTRFVHRDRADVVD